MQSSSVKIRLQKYIADCGITSRRKAEDLISQGRVKINGQLSTILGTKVDPKNDVVEVDDKIIDMEIVDKVYMIVNKPRGYITTLNDPENRPTVMDLIKETSERVYPVGRLDYLSEGLLIMTNDGELANIVTHPRFEIHKVYEVKVFGVVAPHLLKKLRSGCDIQGKFIKPVSVRVIKQLPSKTWLEFRLGEGKNREIRRICEASGVVIDKLKRVAIGNLSITGVAPGRYRWITKRQLLNEIGIDENGQSNGIKNVFVSQKRSIRIKNYKKGTPADDQTFQKFKKDTYFEVLKTLKEKKEEEQKNSLKDLS